MNGYPPDDTPAPEQWGGPPPYPERPPVAGLREMLGRPAPITMVVAVELVIIHLTLYAITFVLHGQSLGSGDLAMAIDPSVLDQFGAVLPDLFARGEPWRLLTSAFLHGNSIHLALNVITLISVGRLGERLFGAGVLGLTLVAGAVAGSAAAAVAGEKAVGASGAIVAIAGLIATGMRGPSLPAGLGRAVRRRIFFVVGLMMVLGLGANRIFEATGTAIAISNVAHAGGFAAGLAVGLLTAAPLAPPGPRRRVAVRAATAVAVGCGAGLLVLAGHDITSGLAAGTGPSFRARLLVGERLRTVSHPELGLDLSVPAGWIELGRDESHVVYGPAPGLPFLQVFAVEAPPGSLGAPDLASPDATVAAVRQEVMRHGGTEFVAAPFVKADVGGHSAIRIEVRYHKPNMDLQEIYYVVRGSGRIYSIRFLGFGTTAEVFAERLIGDVRILRE